MADLIYKELSYTIYGLCYKTHNELGRMRNERTYADFLETLLKESGLEYVREKRLKKSFQGETSGRNIPDFVINDLIVLDLKAKKIITKEDYFQMKRYLASSEKRLGLIVNFRNQYLAPRRVLNAPVPHS